MWDSSTRNICSGSTRISTRNISSCCCRNSTSASRNCCTSVNNSDSMKNSGASRNISGSSSASRNISANSSRFNKSAGMNSWSAMTMMSSSIGYATGLGRTSIWEGVRAGFSSTAAIMANSGLTCSASSTSMFALLLRASRRHPKLQVKKMFYYCR